MESLFLNKYKTAANKLILLDYDGTLVDFEQTPDKAIPSKQLLTLLHSLATKVNSKLAVISGRSADSLDSCFSHPSFDLIAEHGVLIKESNQWNTLVQVNTDWKQVLLKTFKTFSNQCANSYIEEKVYTLAWHYRNCEPQISNYFSLMLLDELNKFVDRFNLKITDGNKVIEISSKLISKANAVHYFMNELDYEFVLCIGDDRTDEDMFDALSGNNNAITIKVGEGETFAKYRMNSVKDVHNLLKNLSK